LVVGSLFVYPMTTKMKRKMVDEGMRMVIVMVGVKSG